MEKALLSALEESIAAKEALRTLIPRMAEAARMATESLSEGGKILICGNGGSAADAQHIAAELTGRFECERRSYPALALTTNTSTMTAIANDYTFSQVFRRQVEAFARPGDVVMGISTSGNSPNVVEALKAAREKGAHTIGMTGSQGGAMAELCDVLLAVPSDRTCRIQECHITIGHLICEHIELSLVERERTACHTSQH